ncbi:MAG TPA: ASCH domain-containing protein [Verrucomicrobiae bacterium]|jgi:uncharacterized protein YhfF|nr:ASCH domain-containing protein [Verrucomicrobiae bacterium]
MQEYSFSFGDSPEMADELLALVLAGLKRATCWAAAQGTQGVEVGLRSVVTDGQGKRRAVIETIELTRRRFMDVDESFAYDEGEGNRTLDDWRAAHRDYFTREGTYADDMEVYCERFRLIQVI